jgi:hypothetical protein
MCVLFHNWISIIQNRVATCDSATYHHEAVCPNLLAALPKNLVHMILRIGFSLNMLNKLYKYVLASIAPRTLHTLNKDGGHDFLGSIL